jgi:hypothetical protein
LISFSCKNYLKASKTLPYTDIIQSEKMVEARIADAAENSAVDVLYMSYKKWDYTKCVKASPKVTIIYCTFVECSMLVTKVKV